MSVLIRILVVAACLGVAVFYQNYRQLSRSMPLPTLDYKEYWGPGNAANYKENTEIKAYDITPAPELIEDLKAQLMRPLKLHDPLEGVGFEYGFNSKELEKVVKYWRDNYLTKWNERVAYLKQFPHFQTQIQGLNIHYIHVKPKKTDGKKVLPLLLLHGWPGSVREFYDIIPMLTTPNDKSDYIFEVIAPSLPGYGWSQATSKINCGPIQLAIIVRNLMLRVGHEIFVVQGGDWGSVIGSNIAAIFPQNLLMYHSNMCHSNHPLSQMKTLLTGLFPQFFVPKEYKDFFKPLGSLFMHLMEEFGYFHIQATKPDTIGIALAHNPVGLAAYILEKFSTWTNIEFRKLADGGLTKRYSLDSLLDNIMIYYITNSITTSQRLYAEAFTKNQMGIGLDRVHVTIPTGCSRFRYDLVHSSDFAIKDRFINLITSTYHKDGGHFAAMEVPEVLFNDFVEFVNKAIKNLDSNSKANTDLLNVHYIHIKPKKTDGKKVLPLLLLHGWPGSVREFYDIIPMLTTPNAKSDYVFEVIAPSLPGYAWSQAAAKINFGPIQLAIVLRNLMLRVGHQKFLVQGGDWGSIIGSNMATIFPQNVLAYHSNMCGSNHPISQMKMLLTGLFPQFLVTKKDKDFYKPLGSLFSHLIEESGYMHIQATKPDTIGTVLSHNPVGLAAYILEKFSTWTNIEFRKLADGGLTKRYSLDSLLDNIMIYYITNSITTSQRLYAEAFTKNQMGIGLDRVHVTIPTGCSRFKHDLIHSSDWALKDRFANLITSTHHYDGGHFAAMEVPKVLYNDFVEFANTAFTNVKSSSERKPEL